MASNERIDDLQNGLYLIQNPDKFCFGVDAVQLSQFVKVETGQSVLDLGTGNGIIPLLLCAKKTLQVTGLEIQSENVQLAKRSVILNKLEGQIDILEGDIKDVKSLLKGRRFDVVVSNPPYMNHGGGILNQRDDKSIARHEILCSLEDVVKAAAYTLNFKGRFYMIHRPQRLTDILCTLRREGLEPKEIKFIHSYVDTEATMVLVEAIRGAKPLCKVSDPIILYQRERP